MTPSPEQDLSAKWNLARRLYPIYFELAREFVIDVQACPDLESSVDTPAPERVEQARQWLEEMDQRIQVHQLRQFLQTSSVVNQEGLLSLLQHFLANSAKGDATRDKIDFLLVQYFSQIAPSGLDDADVPSCRPEICSSFPSRWSPLPASDISCAGLFSVSCMET